MSDKLTELLKEELLELLQELTHQSQDNLTLLIEHCFVKADEKYLKAQLRNVVSAGEHLRGGC